MAEMKWINYGDVDFFEYGTLVHQESETEFRILRCLPYSDHEDMFQFADLHVDISDTWIDRAAVEKYADLNRETTPSGYAVACTDYYSWENFGAVNYSWDWQHMTRKEIMEILTGYGIDPENI